MKNVRKMKRVISIEMKSKKYMTQISVSNKSPHYVLFEGDLGELEELSMIEDAMLEVKCTNGVLRLDLSKNEVRKMLSPKKEVE
jgi:hypothetical protein